MNLTDGFEDEDIQENFQLNVIDSIKACFDRARSTFLGKALNYFVKKKNKYSIYAKSLLITEGIQMDFKSS